MFKLSWESQLKSRVLNVCFFFPTHFFFFFLKITNKRILAVGIQTMSYPGTGSCTEKNPGFVRLKQRSSGSDLWYRKKEQWWFFSIVLFNCWQHNLYKNKYTLRPSGISAQNHGLFTPTHGGLQKFLNWEKISSNRFEDYTKQLCNRKVLETLVV